MNLREYLDISSEVRDAIRFGRPVVALETTALAHGLSKPRAQELAARVESAVRAEHAVPAWTAVVEGVLRVGLTRSTLDRLFPVESAVKLSRRDLPIAAATGMTGATTASCAMILASLAGIRVFSAGGIGGAHQTAGGPDVSADLQELRQTPVAVVCSGIKMMLDAEATLEYLETMGVPVVGLRTAEFPGFVCRSSGLPADYGAEDEQTAARIAKAKWDLGLKGGVLIANPVPTEAALDAGETLAAARRAVEDAQARGIRGNALTPFVLDRLSVLTNGRSLHACEALTVDNARAAARIASAYAKL